jgi:hypothetical protein
LLRIPGVGEVVLADLAYLEAALLSFEEHEATREITGP